MSSLLYIVPLLITIVVVQLFILTTQAYSTGLSLFSPKTSLLYSLSPVDFTTPTEMIREFPSFERRFNELAKMDSSDWFNDFFSDLDDFPLDRYKSMFKTMPIDIREDSKNYNVEVDLPGYSKENIKVTVKDRTLTITGERKRVDEDKKDNYRREERMLGRMSRSFSLPNDADENKIQGKYENGVLTLTIEKSPEMDVKKEKMITIM